MSISVGSLFSGYGGLDLGLRSALPRAAPAWFVEFDKHPSDVLRQRFPSVPNLGDITAIDWGRVEPVDVLAGGFPCQDVSHAGKRAGIRPDTRSGLWSHFAYAIDQLRPRLVVIENVKGLLSAEAHSDLERDCWCMGDKRDSDMRALGAVLGDLADLGFDAEWASVRASDIGAPHRRERVFIVAAPHASCERRDWPRPAGQGRLGEPTNGSGESVALLPTPKASDGPNGGPGMRNSRGVADALPGVVALLPTPAVNDMGAGKTVEAWDAWTDAMRARHGNGNGHGKSLAIEAARHADFGPYSAAIARWEAALGRPAPSPTEPGKDRPRLAPRFVEWMMGLPEGWVTDAGIPRSAQLKALGNGVVPGQAAHALSILLPRLRGARP